MFSIWHSFLLWHSTNCRYKLFPPALWCYLQLSLARPISQVGHLRFVQDRNRLHAHLLTPCVFRPKRVLAFAVLGLRAVQRRVVGGGRGGGKVSEGLMSNMLIACTACLRIRLPTRFAMHFAHTHTETVIVEFVIIFIGLTVHIVLARRTYISYVHITRCLLVLRSLCCLCSCSKLSSNNIWARVFIVRAASCACPRAVTFQIR